MGAEPSLNIPSTAIDLDEEALLLSLVDRIASEMDLEDRNHRIGAGKLSVPINITSVCSITDLYTIQSHIGSGVSGSVVLSQSKQTHKQYAIKHLPKSDTESRCSFLREVHALNGVNHPNIIQLNDAYESQQHYHIVIEYCSGGTLLKRLRLQQKNRFSEQESVQLIKQILSAIDHLHTNNIVHRDLKLSNIVFADHDTHNPLLKLIDFGESELINDPCKRNRDTVGSLHFFAPETSSLLRKSDLFASDMWAVGVIAYILIYGAYPFHGNDLRSMIRCVMTTSPKWHSHVPVSDACKHFIQSLLQVNFEKRFNAQQALQHEWIKSGNTLDKDTDVAQVGPMLTKRSRRRKSSLRYTHTNMLSDHDLNAMDIGSILEEIDDEHN
eukprot:1059364_1